MAFKLIYISYEEFRESLWIGDGIHSKSELNRLFLSLSRVYDPEFTVIALRELPNPGEKVENVGLPTIPIELISHSHSLLRSDRYYTPILWRMERSEEQNRIPEGILPPPPSQHLYGHSGNNGGSNNNGSNQYSGNYAVANYDHSSNSSGYNDGDLPDPWQNYEYFYQYGRLDIHGEMLRDQPRTLAYKDAIEKMRDEIKGKVVLDVGTGTGILSFFCAAAGASKVYAVEGSSLADWTEKVVKNSPYSEVIQVIHAQVEDVVLPQKVDFIVSEWMGTFLIFESMLESVLHARNKHLKAGGRMLPSGAQMFVAPMCTEKLYNEKVNFWREVHGVDMSPLIPFAKKCSFEKPIIDKHVDKEVLIAKPLQFKDYDLKSITPTEPYEKTTVPFEFTIEKSCDLHGFVSWFDVTFDGNFGRVVLSCSPDSPSTHWNQQQFLLDEPVAVTEGQVVRGELEYRRNRLYKRHLIVEFSFQVEDRPRDHKVFLMWAAEE
eukprot:TRINITY_DN2656_c0_g1_i1.p1 TRINITY_DN2656_c0_g1~~TRINITY_DN2656_c0_g1_i1.p1  ORF type:complete len:490 (+),score=147.82 TRINITY_DN2656_c0_g1_i1:71-1540(+)